MHYYNYARLHLHTSCRYLPLRSHKYPSRKPAHLHPRPCASGRKHRSPLRFRGTHDAHGLNRCSFLRQRCQLRAVSGLHVPHPQSPMRGSPCAPPRSSLCASRCCALPPRLQDGCTTQSRSCLSMRQQVCRPSSLCRYCRQVFPFWSRQPNDSVPL